eukprot:Nitzschia sp. Nitz4//scaffold151_size53849//11941//12996//NITZ4_006715-RA/size53849-processed-gene-0.44-mRNA-1//1//CDS//3329537120//576//frame0
MNTTKHIPRLRSSSVLLVLDEEDENDCGSEFSKATLSEPRSLAHQLFRLEHHKSALEIAHITNLLADLDHENIIQVRGMGDYFLVTNLWDDTLRSRLSKIARATRKSQTKRSIFGKRPKAPPLNLWQYVALPITRALLYLHNKSIAMGLVTVDTIVLSGDGTKGPPQVFLRDFSKARQVLLVGDYDSSTLLSSDVFQLGLILNEIARVQPLAPGSLATSMDQLIESCCQSDILWRPTIRRVHKRLLEIVRLLPLSNADTVPANEFVAPQQPRAPFLAGFKGVIGSSSTLSTAPMSSKLSNKASSSLCPTENSSLVSDSNWTNFSSSVQWKSPQRHPDSPSSTYITHELSEC